MKTSKNPGFTLLELVIVIIIIGVLTSLALPRLFAVIEGARATEALAHITTLRSAVERYYLMNGTYAPPPGAPSSTILYYDWAVSGSDIDFLGMGEKLVRNPGAHFFYRVNGWNNAYCILVRRRLAQNGGDYRNHIIFFGLGVSIEIRENQTSYAIRRLGDDTIYWNASDTYKSFVPKGN